MSTIRVTTNNFTQEGWETDQAVMDPTINKTTTTQNSPYVTIALPPGNSHNPTFLPGAVYLNLTTQNNTATSILRRVRLRNNQQTHRLADISILKYSTYIVNNINNSAPVIVLQVEKDHSLGLNKADDNIFFNPTFQTGNNPNGEAIPAQPAVVLNQWQEWNAAGGGWAKQSSVVGTPGFKLFTLASYLVENPRARIINSFPSASLPNGGGGVRFTVGGDSPDYRDFKGYVDGFTINKNVCTINPNPPVNTPNRLLVYDFDCN